jgi:Schlafen, AlbA_2
VIDRPFDQIGVEDLQRLVTNEIAEGRTIEYKECLPGQTDRDHQEFLADVSSFANAVGGDLVYGAKERRESGHATGIPESVEGLEAVNEDAAWGG